MRYVFQIVGALAIFYLFFSCEETMRKGKPYGHAEEIIGDSAQMRIPFPVQIDTPHVSDSACFGTYRGVEFIDSRFIEHFDLNGTDIAHQYSNKICEYVGKYLKKRFLEGAYLRVKLSKIKLVTKGMNDDDNYVEYSVFVPFEKCTKERAMTAFDHSGGWGHIPEIQKRKAQLLTSPNKIVWRKKLFVSKLYKTPEGLQEYWIQWKHSNFR